MNGHWPNGESAAKLPFVRRRLLFVRGDAHGPIACMIPFFMIEGDASTPTPPRGSGAPGPWLYTGRAFRLLAVCDSADA